MEFLWKPERLQIGANWNSTRSTLSSDHRLNLGLHEQGSCIGWGISWRSDSRSLNLYGCYAKGNSVLIPPALGNFGNMGRNIFPDSGFKNVDFSLAKNWHFGERLHAQFRAEFFNIFNHPNFANPYGGQNGFGFNDPSVGGFGCGCATPDVAAANPAVGSGGPRSVQLGLKLIF